MPNYLEHRKSISRELIAVKDRVRNFIDDNNWGEDGRYKEIILSEFLKNILPQNVTVATGFVMGDDNRISTQIDIIIYKNSYPVLFKFADFVVVSKDSVVGIIEVKTKIQSSKFRETIEKSHENGKLIGKNIFNGIFGYETSFQFRNETGSAVLKENYGYINNICFGENYFMKYWSAGNPLVADGVKCFSFYKIVDLAFGYFISNLIEDVYIELSSKPVNDALANSLYPIVEGKEAHRLEHLEIRFT